MQAIINVSVIHLALRLSPLDHPAPWVTARLPILQSLESYFPGNEVSALLLTVLISRFALNGVRAVLLSPIFDVDNLTFPPNLSNPYIPLKGILQQDPAKES